MLRIVTTKKFDKSFKRAIKRGKDLSKLKVLINMIAEKKEIPRKYREHKLIGNYENTREFHIEPDWLLIYVIENNELKLIDTGSHSDLFK